MTRYCQGKAKVSVDKPVPVPLASRQIPDAVLSDREFDNTEHSTWSQIIRTFCALAKQVSSREDFFPPWRWGPKRAMTSSFLRFHDHIHRRTTVGRTPLNEWSARRRDLYLTTHNTHNRQTCMATVGFEPTIPVGERPQSRWDYKITKKKIKYILHKKQIFP